jgi:hypothetical protein
LEQIIQRLEKELAEAQAGIGHLHATSSGDGGIG